MTKEGEQEIMTKNRKGNKGRENSKKRKMQRCNQPKSLSY